MASWDDEDFEAPVASTAALTFDEEDEGLMGDDWETAADSDEEKKNKPRVAAPKQPKLTTAEKDAVRRRKEQEEREKKALEKSHEASKLDNMQREIDSDLSNASDLLSAADVHPRSRSTPVPTSSKPSGPAKLSDLAIFKPTSKAEYAELRKTVTGVLNDLAEKNSMNLHSTFVLETCRELIKPLPSAEVNKIIDTLEAISKIKYKDERARRLGAKAKPNVKAASAKAAEKIVPQQNAAEEDDGLSDGDFM